MDDSHDFKTPPFNIFPIIKGPTYYIFVIQILTIFSSIVLFLLKKLILKKSFNNFFVYSCAVEIIFNYYYIIIFILLQHFPQETYMVEKSKQNVCFAKIAIFVLCLS